MSATAIRYRFYGGRRIRRAKYAAEKILDAVHDGDSFSGLCRAL